MVPDLPGGWAAVGPPQTLHAAQPIAAEHVAFSDQAHQGLRGIPEIARALVNNPFWDFWWDWCFRSKSALTR